MGFRAQSALVTPFSSTHIRGVRFRRATARPTRLQAVAALAPDSHVFGVFTHGARRDFVVLSGHASSDTSPDSPLPLSLRNLCSKHDSLTAGRATHAPAGGGEGIRGALIDTVSEKKGPPSDATTCFACIRAA